jgi:hypothetical protein
MLEDPKIDVSTFEQLNAVTMMVTYTIKDEYMVENHASNLPISIWTTAYGRYGLLKGVLISSSNNI